jgi:antitoxin component YwqK of YwqJK toxin-antitoxin module
MFEQLKIITMKGFQKYCFLLVLVSIATAAFGKNNTDSLKTHVIEGRTLNYIGDSISGVREGVWILYDGFKLVSDSGLYLHGKREGVWKSYQVGKLSWVGKYVMGKKEGLWVHTPYKGCVFQGNFKDGKEFGRWFCITSGILTKDEFYNSKGKHGLQRDFYQSGKLRSKVTYVDGEKDGVVELRYQSGKLWGHCEYKMGMAVTDDIEYYESGKVRRRTYHNDKGVQTLTKAWYENGELYEVSKWDGATWVEVINKEKG